MEVILVQEKCFHRNTSGIVVSNLYLLKEGFTVWEPPLPLNVNLMNWYMGSSLAKLITMGYSLRRVTTLMNFMNVKSDNNHGITIMQKVHITRAKYFRICNFTIGFIFISMSYLYIHFSNIISASTFPEIRQNFGNFSVISVVLGKLYFWKISGNPGIGSSSYSFF